LWKHPVLEKLHLIIIWKLLSANFNNGGTGSGGEKAMHLKQRQC
jgi:hypothetical protein